MKTPPMNRSRTASETLSAIFSSHFPPHTHRTTMSKTPSKPAPFRAATTALLLILALLAGVSSAHAQANGSPPERMTFQGFLVDGNGVTLATNAPKNYDVIFRIWDAPTTGNKLWTEQQTVTVDKGYFSILLGEGGTVGAETRNALSTLFNTNTASERHVEMTVKGIGAAGTDVTLLPRLRLLSSPYAFLAQQSVSAGRAAKLVNGAGVDLVTSVGAGISVAGPIIATSVSGNGANLTSLNANQITSGTLDNARTTAAYWNSAQTIVARDGDGGFVANFITASALTARSSRQTHDQGAWLEWNKEGAGLSYLLNQKGGGTGGIVFGEVSTADVITERMRIDGGGNVGIGTNSPTSKLHVAGQVTADSFKIKNTPTLVLYGIYRGSLMSDSPTTGVSQTRPAPGNITQSGLRNSNDNPIWWKSDQIGWGTMLYTGTFVVPAGEQWEVAYTCQYYWQTDDLSAIVWTLNDALPDDEGSYPLGLPMGPQMFNQNFTLSAGSNVVRVKAFIGGGSGPDVIYFPWHKPSHFMVRKYKVN